MREQTTLVATLGGQPQIITFTLDLLLDQGEMIDQVVIVYMASTPRYQEAYRSLAGEFAADQYRGHSCHLRSVPIRLLTTGSPQNTVTLADARTPSEVEAVRATVFALLAELKAQGHRVLLSLSGGRRIMALVALSAAMQHLTPADSVWHIYTPPDFLDKAHNGTIMHAPPDVGVQLVRVPFVPWAAYFPGLRPLLDTPASRPPALSWMSDNNRRRCEQVWKALTPRQQEVLRSFAQGLSRKQIAEHLGIEATTVDSHRKTILEKCSLAWQEDGPAQIDTAFLRGHFGPFLTTQG